MKPAMSLVLSSFVCVLTGCTEPMKQSDVKDVATNIGTPGKTYYYQMKDSRVSRALCIDGENTEVLCQEHKETVPYDYFKMALLRETSDVSPKLRQGVLDLMASKIVFTPTAENGLFAEQAPILAKLNAAFQRASDPSLVVAIQSKNALTCAATAGGAKCWGLSEWLHRIAIPQLSMPTQIVTGGMHSCGLTSDGVACWGFSIAGNLEVPKLQAPTQLALASGVQRTCALTAEGVKCWGGHYNDAGKVPDLVQPSQIVAGLAHFCALAQDGVKCWGSNSQHQMEVPALNAPFAIAAADSASCAITADGVKCWGDTSRLPTEAPQLNQPSQLAMGVKHICALTAEGVTCWGDQSRGQTKVPALKSPVQITAGNDHTCALTAEGVRCWGDNSYYQTQVPAGL